MRYLTFGILAHVDAGKTTLSEALLLAAGAIRKAGRVDYGDTVLDSNEIERERGITVFSKQARLQSDGISMTLLDTPGHVDFSAEMERVLSVLDAAVLVVSAPEGLEAHTLTLWNLLKRYDIPVFIFVNKMDQQGTDWDAVLSALKERLSGRIVDFSSDRQGSGEFLEDIALSDEKVLSAFLDNGNVSDDEIRQLILTRKLFPCFFGSALKLSGTSEFFIDFVKFAPINHYKDEFGARVFKIAHDPRGERLTFLKITGGKLHVKDIVLSEKVNQIRLYSGDKYETSDEAPAGEVCAVTGISTLKAGDVIGSAGRNLPPLLMPVMKYRIILPSDVSPESFMPKLTELAEEIPELSCVYDTEKKEIMVSLMGEVQLEVLTRLIRDRYSIGVSFGEGSILYKETVDTVTEGVGHFEPLRHYAEVHVVLSPGERGSGITLDSVADTDMLSANWQKLILSSIKSSDLRGVLTGSPLTDMHITLAAGRDNVKHTVGGDFREAAIRAVRNGLMRAGSVLLEPYYDVTLRVPVSNTGRAMTDLEGMQGSISAPEQEGDFSIIKGRVPVSEFGSYALTVRAYTKGEGSVSVSLSGYDRCHNAEEVIQKINYYPEADVAHTADSVFCAHGAGFVVPWYDVPSYMHLPSVLYGHDAFFKSSGEYPVYDRLQGGVIDEDSHAESENDETSFMRHAVREDRQTETGHDEIFLGVDEVDSIVAGAAGANRRKEASDRRSHWNRYERSIKDNLMSSGPACGKEPKDTGKSSKRKLNKEDFLLVDGYNIIFAWPSLRELAAMNIDSARDSLIEILSNYQGYTGVHLILVFDAYKVHGGIGSITRYHGIDVVYTKEAETADEYIAKTSGKLTGQGNVTVATSDNLVQLIIFGAGAARMSASDLMANVNAVNARISDKLP